MSDAAAFATLRLGGLPVIRATREALAQQMVRDALAARAAPRPPKLVFSANGAFLVAANRDPAFRRLACAADLIPADGMPLVHASRLFGKPPLPERICTTDFIIDAIEAACVNGLRFYFLGSREADNAAACAYFARAFPKLQIAGRHHGYFDKADEPAICADIVASRTDVLWVGLGQPLQERFSVENRERLTGVGWIKTCGGLLDYYSGRNPRAPFWMQRAGLEWLFRATIEPRRLAPRYARTNLPALYYLLTRSGGAGGGDTAS